MRPLLLAVPTLLAVLSAAHAARGQDAAPDWLLVRGDAPGYGRLDWQAIGEAYLGRTRWRLVDAAGADDAPAASRMVVGTLADNPALAALAPRLGLARDGASLRHHGHALPDGAGVVVVARDPDGAGLLAAFAGADPAGVFSTFTISVDITRPGAHWARDGQRLEPGAADVDTDRLRVVRLDLDADHLLEQARDDPPGERALRVGRGLAGFGFVLAALTGSGDGLSFARDLLGPHAAAVESARARSRARDPAHVVREAAALVDERLGPPPRGQPVVFLSYGDPAGTNARTIGPDPLSGRPCVVLNLCALGDAAALEIAALHELVHVRQRPVDGSLGARAVHEGVASRLTQLLRPATSDAEALMWSPAQLAAAEAQAARLVAGLRAEAAGGDPAAHARWLVLGARERPAPGVPDRSGYFVGWRAAAAWLAADARRRPADLLQADVSDVLAALE